MEKNIVWINPNMKTVSIQSDRETKVIEFDRMETDKWGNIALYKKMFDESCCDGTNCRHK